MTRRYCVILEELRLEAARLIEAPLPSSYELRAQHTQDQGDTPEIVQDRFPIVAVRDDHMDSLANAEAVPSAFFDLISPPRPGSWADQRETDLDNYIADISSWVQFDSLVRYDCNVRLRLELTFLLFRQFRPSETFIQHRTSHTTDKTVYTRIAYERNIAVP